MVKTWPTKLKLESKSVVRNLLSWRYARSGGVTLCLWSGANSKMRNMCPSAASLLRVLDSWCCSVLSSATPVGWCRFHCIFATLFTLACQGVKCGGRTLAASCIKLLPALLYNETNVTHEKTRNALSVELTCVSLGVGFMQNVFGRTWGSVSPSPNSRHPGCLCPPKPCLYAR